MNLLKRIGLILGDIGLFLVGLALAEVGLEDPESLFQILGVLFCAGVFIVFAILHLSIQYKEYRVERLNMKAELASVKSFILPIYPDVEDKSPLDFELTDFRNNFHNFFDNNINKENEDIQNNVSQIYHNILTLQKQRLNRKNVTMRFESVRKGYSKLPVQSNSFFDGKYDITEVKEEIAAKTTYYNSDKEIYSKTDGQTALYTLLKAKQVGDDEIYCPNCGAKANRKNLLDGCDYCGTKFMIEDLELSVANFALRKNYDVEYKKYNNALMKFNIMLAIGITAICLAGSLIMAIIAGKTLEAGFFMSLVAIIGSALIATFAFVLIGLPFMDLMIFPFFYLSGAFSHLTKKTLNKMKNSLKKEVTMEKKVKQADEYFSLTAFYSGVINKLAMIHFAQDNNQASAFFCSDAVENYQQYQDVIDMDVIDIDLTDYRIENDLQLAIVEVNVNLLNYNGDKTYNTNEKINLELVKDVNCKSQAICGPAVLTCKGCGAPISLADGKKCLHCGKDVELIKHDWVIRKYKRY